MRVVIGGRYQGKKAYAQRQYPDRCIWDNFVGWFREELNQGKSPEEECRRRIEEIPDMVILAEEISCGVISIQPGEEAFRERYGRFLCMLVKEAESVERMFCGIPERLK